MNELQKLVQEEVGKLQKAKDVLGISFSNIAELNFKKQLSQKDLIELEAFTARFARLADIFMQGTLKTIDELELENEGSVRDRINRAEKRGIVDDAAVLINIKKLRNKMAHEYILLSPEIIFESAKNYTPALLQNVDRALKYFQNFIKEF